MYYMNATMEKQRRQDTCANVNVQSAIWNLPDNADVPLPPNPALEDIATGHHHHHAMTGDNNEGDNSVVTAPVTQPPTMRNRGPSNAPGNTFLKTDSSRNNGLLNDRRKPQGRYPTSFNNGDFGTNLLDDANRDSYGDYDVSGRSPYLSDYPNYEDYYDVVRQRNRNRLKSKPSYDLYDSPNSLGYSEFPSQTGFPALSRNRNKDFNEKYDEYAGVGGSGKAESNVINVTAKKGNMARQGAAGGGSRVQDKAKTLPKSSSGTNQGEGIAVL